MRVLASKSWLLSPAAAVVLVIFAIAVQGCGDPGPGGVGGPVTFGGALAGLSGEMDRAVTVAGAGDVNLGDGVTPYLTSNGVNYPWKDARDVFGVADIAFVNLECCIASVGTPVSGKEFCFRGPADSAAGLRWAGVDVVSLANNHTKDYGAEALRETLTHLDENAIAWCGAGENATGAYSPAVVVTHGMKVALVAFTSVVPSGWPATSSGAGCATTWDHERVAGVIADAGEAGDYVVASFHWGIELQTSPNSQQRELAHLAVDSGADLVLGHHPHVVQGFELYKNRLIAYSLGNFVFSPPRAISAKTLTVTAMLGPGGLIKARVVPMTIRFCRPLTMSGGAAGSWLETVREYSSDLGTDVTIVGERGYISGDAATGGDGEPR